MAFPRSKIQRTDEEWIIKLPFEGSHNEHVRLGWTFHVTEDERISDPRYVTLLSELQGFLSTAYEGTSTGIRMAPGTMAATYSGLRELAKFMALRGLDTVSKLTSDLTWEFVDHTLETWENTGGRLGRPRVLSFATAYKVLRPVAQLYHLRLPLSRQGYATLPEPPYSGQSAFSVVKKYLKLAEPDTTGPIPDEIAIPTLDRATRWLLIGADDVIKLHELVSEIRDKSTSPADKPVALAEARGVIAEYRFGNDPRTGEPWHAPLTTLGDPTPLGTVTEIGEFEALWRIVRGMIAACVTVIQALTGMRAHEIIGIRAVPTSDGGLHCLQRLVSTDGLMEIHLISGVTAKGNVSLHQWTAGLAPLGSHELPLPVVAVHVLERLLQRYRRASGDDHLLLGFNSKRALPKDASSIRRFTAEHLTQIQRQFAVDALVETGHQRNKAEKICANVRGQRWRKTFAHYVFRTDPRLVGALSDHFRHMSELITDQGYIGNDASLLENLEGERVQSTARALLSIVAGEKIGLTGTQRLIEKYRHDLRLEIDEMPGETIAERAASFVKLKDIRIWTGQYASCMIPMMPSESRCNPDAELAYALARPNYAARSPSTCISCPCCLIMPEHSAFWERRLAENERIAATEQNQPCGVHSIATRRVLQSKAVLRAIGELSSTDPKITSGDRA